jgi:8-oxo-dGTP pyrophosphatase MutT (NUDIX family)
MKRVGPERRPAKKRHPKRIRGRTHRLCASVIVLKKEADGAVKILIVHKPRKRDSWQIPQGGVELWETVQKAAKRELLEETGIRIRGSLKKCSQVYQYDYPAGFLRSMKPTYEGQKLVFFTAKMPPDSKVKVDQQELDAYKWVTRRDLKNYLKRKDYRRTVELAVSFGIKRLLS